MYVVVLWSVGILEGHRAHNWRTAANAVLHTFFTYWAVSKQYNLLLLFMVVFQRAEKSDCL